MHKLLLLLPVGIMAHGKKLHPEILDYNKNIINPGRIFETDNFHTETRHYGETTHFGNVGHGEKGYITFDFKTNVRIDHFKIKTPRDEWAGYDHLEGYKLTMHDEPCVPAQRARTEMMKEYNTPQDLGQITYWGPFFETDFTASAWVYRTGGGDEDRYIFSADESSSLNKRLHLIIRNNKYYMGFYRNDCGSDRESKLNTWEYVTFWYSSTAQEQRIYVNGELAKSCKDKAPFQGLFVNAWLGGRGGTNSEEDWVGRIKEAKVYNRALSDFELRADAEILEIPTCRFDLGRPRGAEILKVDDVVEREGGLFQDERSHRTRPHEGRLVTLEVLGRLSDAMIRWVEFEGEEVKPRECARLDLLSVEVDVSKSSVGDAKIKNLESLTVEQNGCGSSMSLGTPSISIGETTEMSNTASFELDQTLGEAFGMTETTTIDCMVAATAKAKAGNDVASVEVESTVTGTMKDVFTQGKSIKFATTDTSQSQDTKSTKTVRHTKIEYEAHIPWEWVVYKVSFYEQEVKLDTTFEMQCVYEDGRRGAIKSFHATTTTASQSDVEITVERKTDLCPEYQECKCIRGLNSDYIFGERCMEHPGFPGRQGCYVPKMAKCGNMRGLGTQVPDVNTPIHIHEPEEWMINYLDFPIAVENFEWSYVPCGHDQFSEDDIEVLRCQRFTNEDDCLTEHCRWRAEVEKCINLPTSRPTAAPTDTPTSVPTSTPTDQPTDFPTYKPTIIPTASPSYAPTENPTAIPTASPTDAPTSTPTSAPTSMPSLTPTAGPTSAPSPSKPVQTNVCSGLRGKGKCLKRQSLGCRWRSNECVLTGYCVAHAKHPLFPGKQILKGEVWCGFNGKRRLCQDGIIKKLKSECDPMSTEEEDHTPEDPCSNWTSKRKCKKSGKALGCVWKKKQKACILK